MKRHNLKNTIGAVLVLAVALFFFITIKKSYNEDNSKSNQKGEPKQKRDTLSTIVFVDSLIKLGYLKYALDKDFENLKVVMLSDFDRKYGIPILYSNDSNICIDYRHYLCDCESVFESGGIPEILKELKPAFRKRGIKIIVNNYYEDFDTTHNWLNEKITINETEYIIFKNYKGFGWGEATFRLAEILNTEFKKQGCTEKIYLSSGGNNGQIFILSNEIYQLMNDNLKDTEWKPMEILEWAKVNYVNINCYN
jgi:hypothetical protein